MDQRLHYISPVRKVRSVRMYSSKTVLDSLTFRPYILKSTLGSRDHGIDKEQGSDWEAIATARQA